MLSDRIKQLRKKHGLSQEALAEKLEISRQAISKWESGSSNPDIEYVIKMSDVFSISTDYILKGDAISDAEPKEKQVTIIKSASKTPLVLGIISSSISLIGLFILKLQSSFFNGFSQSTAEEVEPGKFVEVSAEHFYGFSGFLKSNHIEWTLTLCIILLLVGIACFIIYIINKKKYTN